MAQDSIFVFTHYPLCILSTLSAYKIIFTLPNHLPARYQLLFVFNVNSFLSFPDAMVIHMYQLLRSLNPHMQPVLELMLPQNLAYLAPTVPLKGVPRQQQLMLSPASLAGSVFMSR